MRRLADGLIVAGFTLILSSLVSILVQIFVSVVGWTLALSLGIAGGLAVRLGGALHVRLARRPNNWRERRVRSTVKEQHDTK